MSIDFSGLGDLAKTPRGKVGWEPLTQDRLGEGSVLAYDQSLTATGWAKVINYDMTCEVIDAGVIKAPTAENKIEVQLQRGVTVFEQGYVMIEEAARRGFSVIHESPPNPGQVKGGGYGSLLAAQSLRNAAALAQVPIEMLGAQPAKTLICGSSKAKKPEAHAALKAHCLPWILGADKITNEATRDALCIALLWLYRRA